MSEYAPQTEQSEFNPDDRFMRHLNDAFDAAAAIRTRLYALLINHGQKTPQQAEAMAQIASQLQQMADSLGA